MKRPLTSQEIEVLAHRYLYYVSHMPVLSNSEYDRLERTAMLKVGDDSPLLVQGSSASAAYPKAAIARAQQLRVGRK